MRPAHLWSKATPSYGPAGGRQVVDLNSCIQASAARGADPVGAIASCSYRRRLWQLGRLSVPCPRLPRPLPYGGIRHAGAAAQRSGGLCQGTHEARIRTAPPVPPLAPHPGATAACTRGTNPYGAAGAAAASPAAPSVAGAAGRRRQSPAAMRSRRHCHSLPQPPPPHWRRQHRL